MKKTAAALLALVLLLYIPVALAGDIINYVAPDDPPALGAEGQLEVHLINAGPVDSILLRCDGQTMMVDCGLPESSERIIKYLKSIGVERLDYAFVTHPHIDHIGGYVGVLEGISIDTFYWPPLYDEYKSAIQDKLLLRIKRKNIPILTPENNEVMYLGDAKLTIMQYQNAAASVNDRSMIIKVEYGERTILLAGDLENAGQAAIVAEYGESLQADILKMPHHGLTQYTDEVDAAVRPVLGVSSNGKGVSETLDSYTKHNVDYMISVMGTVVATTDGQIWQVWQISTK